LSDSTVTDDAFINSIIGEGTRFKGEFDLSGLLRIDGDFTGVIRTKGKVLIGKNGRAECTLQAGTVVVGGVIRGEIFSTEKVIILSTGLVLGNITTPRLIIEEGVVFNGSCKVTAQPGPENRRDSSGNGQRAAGPSVGGEAASRSASAVSRGPTVAVPGARR
jgi:cytoskeletal protein CcmA (bactofilin family)